MTTVSLIMAALPGLPDVRLCSAGDCRWLVAFMTTFLVVLVGLFALAVFFQIRNHFEKESDSFWRKVM